MAMRIAVWTVPVDGAELYARMKAVEGVSRLTEVFHGTRSGAKLPTELLELVRKELEASIVEVRRQYWLKARGCCQEACKKNSHLPNHLKERGRILAAQDVDKVTDGVVKELCDMRDMSYEQHDKEVEHFLETECKLFLKSRAVWTLETCHTGLCTYFLTGRKIHSSIWCTPIF